MNLFFFFLLVKLMWPRNKKKQSSVIIINYNNHLNRGNIYLNSSSRFFSLSLSMLQIIKTHIWWESPWKSWPCPAAFCFCFCFSVLQKTTIKTKKKKKIATWSLWNVSHNQNSKKTNFFRFSSVVFFLFLSFFLLLEKKILDRSSNELWLILIDVTSTRYRKKKKGKNHKPSQKTKLSVYGRARHLLSKNRIFSIKINLVQLKERCATNVKCHTVKWMMIISHDRIIIHSFFSFFVFLCSDNIHCSAGFFWKYNPKIVYISNHKMAIHESIFLGVLIRIHWR